MVQYGTLSIILWLLALSRWNLYRKCVFQRSIYYYRSLEPSGQDECRTPLTEYRSAEAGSEKNLTQTGMTLLSTDIDRSMERQYMDTPSDRTHSDPATKKPDEILLHLVDKRRIWRQCRKNKWCRKASTMTENRTESNKAAYDPPSNGTSAPRRKRTVRSHQWSENCIMAEKPQEWLDCMDRNVPPELRSMQTEDRWKSGRWWKIRTRRVRSRWQWKNGRVRRPPAPGGRSKWRCKRKAGSAGKEKPKRNGGLN